MRLSVRHGTLYEFETPMRFVTQSHRLTPVSNGMQTVHEWKVSAEGAMFGAGFVDGGGDAVNTMTVQGPVTRIEVVVEGVVETTDTAGVLRNHREMVFPRVYMQPTAAIKPNRALIELAAAAIEGVPEDHPLERSHRLSTAVADAITYTPGATTAATTASEALELGNGVCQDMTHVLISAAHACGLPARYVTGYLLIGEGNEVGEAAHAWAEIFVETVGWIGFDAANRCCPDERYIRLGSGRDAQEVAPIRGVSRGVGVEAMDVSVLVAQQ
jgi:transglutaminase-like putative cysteine protease